MAEAIQIHIPEPCHESWHNMTPKEQGRFCGSCQKIVVDFSAMTDKELLDYISNASQHVCGRFSHDQLNTDLKKTENKRRFSWAYVWNILLATFLFTEAKAQGKPVIKKKPAVQQLDLLPRMGTIAVIEPEDLAPPREISGTVVDIDSKPMAGASIYVKGAGTGTVSDTLGNFHLPVNMGDTVIVSYIGYNTQTLVVDSNTNWQNLKISFAELHVTMGIVAVKYVKPKKEKVKRVINDWKPAALKRDIKIYPNPIARGNAIQADLSLKQTGSYKLELMDVQGRVVEVQKLVMTAKEQRVTIPTQTGWSPGIYYIRISAPGIKNVYQGKVAIQ
ncbi:MAG TPA: carboxypeptidase-like regulatory domain-containing protein [Niastella sp.]